jgi:hypothetical protein
MLECWSKSALNDQKNRENFYASITKTTTGVRNISSMNQTTKEM